MPEETTQAAPATETPAAEPKPLWKSKTVWAGVTGLVSAVAAYATGAMSPAEAIQTGLASLLAIFFRDALRTK